MSEHVPADQIEEIVGTRRHPTKHIGRAVSAEQTVYIMHPDSCLRYHDDLRECRYSRALDKGIVVDEWRGFEDRPVVLSALSDGRLCPRFDQEEAGDE